MLRHFILYVVLFVSAIAHSQSLSTDASISLITCGPGNDLYATFGHSALYIQDPKNGIDKVYNYGTFDFHTPNFYLKFARGKLNYYLHVTNFQRFIRTYQYEGRWVYRQQLNMSVEQKQLLYVLLEENAKPENREYKYDFFYDNCSTRLRDMLEKALGNNLIYPDIKQKSDTTFRDLIDIYLQNHPWSDLGIDLALGAPCDKKASWAERMFLPDFLMENIGQSKVRIDGATQPFVIKELLILPENAQLIDHKKERIDWIFWTAFVLVGLVSIFLSARVLKWFDIFFFTLVGILGIAVFLLWFATDHTATKWNFNLLWALPTWLIAPYYLLTSKGARFFRFHAIGMFALVVFWIFIPQNLHTVTVPLILILAIRSWAWNKHFFRSHNHNT